MSNRIELSKSLRWTTIVCALIFRSTAKSSVRWLYEKCEEIDICGALGMYHHVSEIHILFAFYCVLFYGAYRFFMVSRRQKAPPKAAPSEGFSRLGSFFCCGVDIRNALKRENLRPLMRAETIANLSCLLSLRRCSQLPTSA